MLLLLFLFSCGGDCQYAAPTSRETYQDHDVTSYVTRSFTTKALLSYHTLLVNDLAHPTRTAQLNLPNLIRTISGSRAKCLDNSRKIIHNIPEIFRCWLSIQTEAARVIIEKRVCVLRLVPGNRNDCQCVSLQDTFCISRATSPFTTGVSLIHNFEKRLNGK